MSLILRHAIKIDAPLEVVFLALSQVQHIAAWHHGPVQGDLAVGEVLYINPSSDLKFGWKTNEIVGHERSFITLELLCHLSDQKGIVDLHSAISGNVQRAVTSPRSSSCRANSRSARSSPLRAIS